MFLVFLIAVGVIVAKIVSKITPIPFWQAATGIVLPQVVHLWVNEGNTKVRKLASVIAGLFIALGIQSATKEPIVTVLCGVFIPSLLYVYLV